MNRRAGFGLLEILIVVTIIAVLAYGGAHFGNFFAERQSAVENGNNAIEQAEKLQQQLDRQAESQSLQMEKLYEQARSAAGSSGTH